MALDADRLGALSAAKLRGLLTVHLGTECDAPVTVGDGAAVVVDGTAWMYQAGIASLGAAMVWAAAKGADRVAVVVDELTDAVSHELAGLDIEVFQAVERTLRPAGPVVAPRFDEPAVGHPLLATLESEGLDVVRGHGLWHGEVLGLEVARLVGDGPDLQLGVGAYDRGAFEALYPDRSPIDALADVVADVRSHRHPGAPPHLLNRLVRERWLRADLCAEPATLGLDSLVAVPGIAPRAGLHVSAPDAAIGGSGESAVLVVTSVGVLPAGVPYGAAVAARERADRIVFVVPERDRHPAFVGATQYLRLPTEVVGVTPPWSR